ncbi:MAG: hypothetical protein EOO14_27060 [Chitinophagaceae bacterium]|nr:MAG: hypothetical protein EOO14_27060 [Chitinophagaceae bacterium]
MTFTGTDCRQLQNLPAGYLLARKFDAGLDAGILDCIDKQLRERRDVVGTASERMGLQEKAAKENNG